MISLITYFSIPPGLRLYLHGRPARDRNKRRHDPALMPPDKFGIHQEFNNAPNLDDAYIRFCESCEAERGLVKIEPSKVHLPPDKYLKNPYITKLKQGLIERNREWVNQSL